MTLIKSTELVIGIDIGGTNTKLGLVDKHGNIIARHAFPTAECKGEEGFVNALIQAVQALRARVKGAAHFAGIGIGAPGCNEKKGAIAGAANLPFQSELNLGPVFEKEFDLPSKIVKDSNAAALGELQFGGAQKMKNFILLTLGTGLGASVVINGKVVTGATGLASEFGHTMVVKNGRACNCGKRGCLETYISATGLKRTVLELMATENLPSVLREYTFSKLDALAISQAAKEGDPLAMLAFEKTGEMLGEKIADLVAQLEPEAIFLAGGLIRSGKQIMEPTRRHARANLLHLFKGKVQILSSTLGANDAGLLGAAALIWSYHYH